MKMTKLLDISSSYKYKVFLTSGEDSVGVSYVRGFDALNEILMRGLFLGPSSYFCTQVRSQSPGWMAWSL